MYSKLVVDIISQVNRLSCTDIISFFLLYAVLVHVVYKVSNIMSIEMYCSHLHNYSRPSYIHVEDTTISKTFT